MKYSPTTRSAYWHLSKIAVLTLCSTLVLGTGLYAKGGDQDRAAIKIEASLISPLRTPGLGGNVSIEVEDEEEDGDGFSTSKIEVKPVGLTPGNYQVNVALLSGSSSIFLGGFTIPVQSPKQKRNPEIEFGDDGIPLPDGLDPLDITSLAISNEANTPLLVATFSGTSSSVKMERHLKVPTTPGIAAPQSSGRLSIQANYNKGSVKGRFALEAKNLPAGTVAFLMINGVDVGSYLITRKGSLKIERSGNFSKPAKKNGGNSGKGLLPDGIDLFSIRSVSLYVAGGAELLRVVERPPAELDSQ